MSKDKKSIIRDHNRASGESYQIPENDNHTDSGMTLFDAIAIILIVGICVMACGSIALFVSL